MEDNIRISSSVISHIGDASQYNEDSYFANGQFMYQRKDCDVQVSISSSEDMQVFAVSKGMNAGYDGGKSSLSFNNELKRFMDKNQDGRKTADELFTKLYELVEETSNLISSMSDTDEEMEKPPVFAGFLVKGSEAGVLSLGDTRIYRLRNGNLKQLTADHRRTERLLKLGIITDEQAETVSSRFGDSAESELSKVKRTEIFELSAGDIYVLSNSETLDYIDEDALLYILSMEEDTSMLAGTLMDEVLKRHSGDNITLQVVRVDKLPAVVTRPKAASTVSAASPKYTPIRTVRVTRSVSGRTKIIRIVRSFIITVIVCSLIFGMFWLINRLLFPKDREASGEPDTITTTSASSQTGTGTGSSETTQPTTTRPTETTAPTTQQSTATTAPSTTQTGQRTYTVKSGDSLMSIARQFYNDASKYKLIQEANNIEDPNHIVVGQKLVIPEIN